MKKFKPLTDQEWVKLTRLTVEFVHDGLRLGQSYMNALAQVKVELYNHITEFNPDIDPFYNNKRLPNFILYLNSLEE